jgi:hypothetical protein
MDSRRKKSYEEIKLYMSSSSPTAATMFSCAASQQLVCRRTGIKRVLLESCTREMSQLIFGSSRTPKDCHVSKPHYQKQTWPQWTTVHFLPWIAIYGISLFKRSKVESSGQRRLWVYDHAADQCNRKHTPLITEHTFPRAVISKQLQNTLQGGRI